MKFLKKKSTLLAQYNTLEEISQIEPYKTLFAASGKKLLVTEKKEDGQVYRIYTHTDNPDKVYLYKVDGKSEKLEGSFPGSFFSLKRQTAWLLK